MVYGREDDVDIGDEDEEIVSRTETVTPESDVLVSGRSEECIERISLVFRKEKKMMIQIVFLHHQIFVQFMFLLNQRKAMVNQ